MSIWKSATRSLLRVSVMLLLSCAMVLAQEGQPKATPPAPALTVLVDGVSEPVYRVRDGVKPPRPTYSPAPECSEEARSSRVQGAVMLGIIVTSAGRPTHIRVLQSLGSGLDEKAVEAVSQWKFKPATKDGKPVAVEIAVEVNFNLQKRP